MGSTVWLLTAVALTIVPIFYVLVARAELYLGYNAHFFSSLWNSFWYNFSTILGESITQDISMEKTWALRYD